MLCRSERKGGGYESPRNHATQGCDSRGLKIIINNQPILFPNNVEIGQKIQNEFKEFFMCAIEESTV